MRTNKAITGTFYGMDITIPKGTALTHNTACGIDKNYHFVSDWSWLEPEKQGFGRTMLLHDLEHRGVNVNKEDVDYG